MRNTLQTRCFQGLAAALLTIALSGCAAQPAAQGPVPIGADDYRRTFEAAVETLRTEGFVVARQDYRFGRITTQPRSSPAFFEIWKSDNSTAGQAAGGTINAEDRVVTVKFDPAAPQAASQYALAVEVAIHRRQRPTRRLSGSTDGSHLVRPLLDVPDSLDKKGATTDYRTFVELDEPMAAKLLALILQRAAQPAPVADASRSH